LAKQPKVKTLIIGLAIILATGIAMGLVEQHEVSAANGANGTAANGANGTAATGANGVKGANGANGTSAHGANGNSANGADDAITQGPNGDTVPKSGIFFS
jgi:hypothetical protein